MGIHRVQALKRARLLGAAVQIGPISRSMVTSWSTSVELVAGDRAAEDAVVSQAARVDHGMQQSAIWG
jgi:hypothetical protein